MASLRALPTLVALLVLGALVLVHELAHLVAARAIGARALVFRIGLGPPLLAFRAGGQRWVLGAVPLGGWLQLEGEDPYRAPGPRSGTPFTRLGTARRALVLLAGPAASLLLGLAVLTVLHAHGTYRPVPMTVGSVEPGSEAARAGIRPGDRILAVDGTPVARWGALVQALADRAGRPARLSIRRVDADLVVVVQPTVDGSGRGRIGVDEQYAFVREPFGPALGAAFHHAGRLLRQTASWAASFVRSTDGPGAAASLLRRVGAVQSADAAARALAAASLALGLLYLLPLPSLDGGRLLLVLWERLRGRPLDARIQTGLQLLSLLLTVVALGWVAGHELHQVLDAARRAP